MSSLGDLLLSHLKPHKDGDVSPRETISTPKKTSNDEEEGQKNDKEDNHSDVSSTDDYVRELLDPDDRPRNVWHVIEGPAKEQSNAEDNQNTKDSIISEESRKSEDSKQRRDRDEHTKDRTKHRSHRRHNRSDDEDEDRRHHRDHRRHRSRSRVSSRRRERSRSKSLSPTSKRNSKTVLVMHLNPKVRSIDLEDFFSDVGRVREVRLIMDSKTRRHKGIAYIEFEDTATAAKAFALSGKKFFGAPVVIQSVQSDRYKSSSDRHTSSTSQSMNHTSSHTSSRTHLPPNCYRIYVGGLNVNLTEDMIRSVFEPFGPIIRLELMRDRVTNIPRGYAFITYAYVEDGQNAVKCLDGLELGGKAIRVSKSTDKNERNPASGPDADSTRAGGQHDSDQDSRSGRPKDVTANLYELAGHHK